MSQLLSCCSLELSPPVYLFGPVMVMEYLVGCMGSDVKSFSNVTVEPKRSLPFLFAYDKLFST